MTEQGRKRTSLTSQSAWILGAKFIGFVVNTLLPLLVVRYLSVENVGVYRQSFIVAADAVLVLPLGLSMSAYYFLNRDPEKQPAAILNIVGFNFLMGAAAFLLLFFYPQVLGKVFQSPELERLAPVIGAVIWLWLLAGFLETVALAVQEARLAAGFIVLFNTLKATFMVGAVVVYGTVDSLLYAALAMFGAQTIVMIGFLHKRFPTFWTAIDPPFFRKQVTYALPFGLSVLLYVGQTDVHNYFVSHSFSAAEFAIYSVGCFQLPLIAMLYESVGAVMIPRMSQLQDENRNREILLLAAAATQKLAFFYFPFFAFFMIVADELITTLFTNQYAASANIFRINLFVLPLYCLVVDPITRAFIYAGRFLLKVRIVICVVLFTVFWLGIGRFGLIQMISIVVIAIFLEKLMAVWISARMLEARFRDISLFNNVGKLAIAATIGAAGLLAFYLTLGPKVLETTVGYSRQFISSFDVSKGHDLLGGTVFLGVCFGIYIFVYLAAAAALEAIDPDDKERFLTMLRRVAIWRKVEEKAA
ncbi:MAG TPA: oligosaccharide flippase family protein [Pyrinomonadaceae bacterium]|nr:oligosaccharide flippase family protein [Pyrinomonadaceae bacterium]